IRTYNRADYIAEAIESVFAQTFSDLELIVVDDGSTDGTKEVLAQYDGRLKALYLEHTGNLSYLGNSAIRASDGEFVAFLDSDDIWLPEKLELQIKLLDGNNRFGFSYTNGCLLYPDGTRSAPALQPEQIVSGSVLPTLVRNMCVHISTTVIRRTCFDRSGWFDERRANAEDFSFFLNLAVATGGVCVPQAMTLIRQHGGQMSTALGLSRYQEAINVLEELLLKHGLDRSVRRDVLRTIARHHTHIARKLIENGESAQARPHLLQAFRRNPLHRPAWRWALRGLI
ncbi:MAG TPA: glycosyltransferase, partial [Blastocatellia bacterium]|nr:glycosyltransferase [Blastocatellia bacterium]